MRLNPPAPRVLGFRWLGAWTETLQAAATQDRVGDFEADFTLFQRHLDDRQPCYICYKHDTPDKSWLFVAYVPDFAKVREKMLYASTRSALKKNLGESHFSDELYGIDKVRRHARLRTGRYRPTAAAELITAAHFATLARLATAQNDLTLEAYHKHKQSKSATAPLTEREEEIQRLRKEEARGR